MDYHQPLVITYRRIEELKPDPANPRRHSTKQIRQIANSINSFGFNAPIAVDHDDNVVFGHGRLLACRQLGVHPIAVELDFVQPFRPTGRRVDHLYFTGRCQSKCASLEVATFQHRQ